MLNAVLLNFGAKIEMLQFCPIFGAIIRVITYVENYKSVSNSQRC